MLALRFKWKGGPRDVVASLPGLTRDQFDELRRFLTGRLAPDTRLRAQPESRIRSNPRMKPPRIAPLIAMR